MYKQKQLLLVFLTLILSINSPLIFANDFATGPTYDAGLEKYRFTPTLKGVPKKDVASKASIISEKGSMAIVNNPLPEAKGLSIQSKGASSQSNCGHCQVLWNERTKKYALLRPSILVGIYPKNDTSEITKVLDKISDISYSLLPQFIHISVLICKSGLQ
jgi:hypothetical protein